MKNIFYKSVATSLAVIAIVAVAGYFSVNFLKRDATLIVDRSLPKLATIGEANKSLASAYNHLLLILTSENQEQRSRFSSALTESSNETTRCLERYKSLMTEDDQDKQIFEDLVRLRENYLTIRGEVMELSDKGDHATALKIFRDNLRTAFEKYHAAGEKLLAYNIQQGEARGTQISTICTLTQVLISFMAVIIFLGGFILGYSR